MEEAVATVRDANGCQGVQDVDCEGLVGGLRVFYIVDVEEVHAKKSLSGSIDTDTEANCVIDRLEDGGSTICMTEVVGAMVKVFLGGIEVVLLLEPLEEL